MNDLIYNIQYQLNDNDIVALKNIYLFRCLTFRQLYENYYSKSVSNFGIFMDTVVVRLETLNLIDEILYNKENIAVFLSKTGIEIVKRTCDLQIEYFDVGTKQFKRGYYRSSELKMLPRLISHQIYLNQFVLDFNRLCIHRKLNINWNYYDEKYLSQYRGIRPDGMISIGNIDFFLEMDMNSENKKQLCDKWTHYRNFLSSVEYTSSKRQIIVLFILEKTTNITNRSNIVKLTASDNLLDKINERFDIITGSRVDLLKIVINMILPKKEQCNIRLKSLKEYLEVKHHFNVFKGQELKDKINNIDFDFYINKVDENNHVISDSGRIQEFFVDYYINGSLYDLSKIHYADHNSSCFKHNFNRDINYIIVTDDLDSLYNELALLNFTNESKIFFTTLYRLKNLPFYKALIQFDNYGEKFCFKNNKLYTRDYDIDK